jgi:hypothetical protein
MTKENSTSPRSIQIRDQYKAPKSAALNKFILGSDETAKVPDTEEEVQDFLKEMGIADNKK